MKNNKTEITETLIVGGGPSGLTTAHTLAENNHEFLLFTDRLGGRLFHSNDGSMNFGATYLNDDYKTLLEFAKRGRRMKIREVYSTQTKNGPLLRFISPKNIRHFPGFIRMVLILRRLRRELREFRKECRTRPQNEVRPLHKSQ